MKAAVLKGVGKLITVEEVPEVIPAENEVVVALKYAGLNHKDLWAQLMPPPFPVPEGKVFILGSDGAGVIAQISPGTQPHLAGKEVIINPSLYWGDNPKAAAKEFDILGGLQDGTFAEYVKVPAQAVYAKPSHLSLEEAAVLPLSGLTAYRALFTRAGLVKGEKVLITGVGGGTALLGLQLAVAIGAEVYVTSGTDQKIEKAIQLGAKKGYNYRSTEWSRQALADTGGFDVIMDSAAGKGFDQLLDVVAPGGRIVLFGHTTGPFKEVSPAKLYFRNISLLGTTMGSKEDFQAMLDLVSKHSIRPVVDQVFPLQETEQAFRKLEQAKQFGKIAIRIT